MLRAYEDFQPRSGPMLGRHKRLFGTAIAGCCWYWLHPFGAVFAVPRRSLLAGPLPVLISAPAHAENWFDVIWGLKTDEQVIEGQEQEVEEDLKKQPFTNFLDRARLMNLEAVLKAEEDTVKDEEKDVERSASRGKAYEKDEGYSRDQQRLKSFSKLADRLRFSNEESQELSDLQQKLKFQ
ncbi:unnamed protein product [Durusdinium trenchii]|uniref:Uncharacterized protein n=1 Tax=Durusdinium trenchii TaxID=1381693 RepID=A0ABP0N9M8_9DINO